MTRLDGSVTARPVGGDALCITVISVTAMRSGEGNYKQRGSQRGCQRCTPSVVRGPGRQTGLLDHGWITEPISTLYVVERCPRLMMTRQQLPAVSETRAWSWFYNISTTILGSKRRVHQSKMGLSCPIFCIRLMFV